tara:strand:+ start:200 stop:637 length:438 start_codon:yes stop_codon:yes gene_type:complete
METKKPIIAWYTYFSWWIFIWFILFKLGLISYSPYMIYVIVFLYVSIKILQHLFILKKEDYTHKNSSSALIWAVVAILIDLFPIFYLKPVINLESFIFTLFLLAIYVLMMTKLKINVINHYINLDMKTLMKNFNTKELFLGMIGH